MKKILSFIVVVSLLVLMTGCAEKVDSLKFIYSDAGAPNLQLSSYEVNIGNKVSGGSLVAELWQNGECIESSPVILNNQTKKINISLLIDGYGTDETVTGVNVQIDTDEVSGSELTRFDTSQGIRGYTFSAYEDNEIIEISADEEVILAAMAFDMGDGVRSIDCKKLVSEPTVLSSYSCIVVVRAKFTTQQVAPQKTNE